MTEEIATSTARIWEALETGTRNSSKTHIKPHFKHSGCLQNCLWESFESNCKKNKSVCFLEGLQGLKNIVAYSSLKWICSIVPLGSVKFKLRSVVEVILEILAVAVCLQLFSLSTSGRLWLVGSCLASVMASNFRCILISVCRIFFYFVPSELSAAG